MANGKAGRPRKELDKEIFERYSKYKVSKQAMCRLLKCDEKTLSRWCKRTYKKEYSEIKQEFSEMGNALLSEAQFIVALEDKNPQMLIHLGKQYLGQSDKVENSTTIEIQGVDFEFTDEE